MLDRLGPRALSSHLRRFCDYLAFELANSTSSLFQRVSLFIFCELSVLPSGLVQCDLCESVCCLLLVWRGEVGWGVQILGQGDWFSKCLSAACCLSGGGGGGWGGGWGVQILGQGDLFSKCVCCLLFDWWGGGGGGWWVQILGQGDWFFRCLSAAGC